MPNLFRRHRVGTTDDGQLCRMCGVAVPVQPDGRCRLGHSVLPAEQVATRAVPEVEAAPTEPPAPAGDAWEYLIEEAEASQPEPFTHPYDEVLAWGDGSAPDPGPEPPPEPAPEQERDGEDRASLDDLFAWNQAAPSALDVSVEDL